MSPSRGRPRKAIDPEIRNALRHYRYWRGVFQNENVGRAAIAAKPFSQAWSYADGYDPVPSIVETIRRLLPHDLLRLHAAVNEEVVRRLPDVAKRAMVA
jgi:hypothetical protein